jgi:RHS repeat-associated protein
VIQDQTGAQVWTWGHGPFGDSLSWPLTAFDTNVRFPGQYFDAETYLHHNGARDYSLALGRYIESDPIGLSGGINTYAYARNNPVNLVDPDGLYAAALPILIGIGLIPPTIATINYYIHNPPILPNLHIVLNESADKPCPNSTSIVDEKGKKHILEGDETGGGHRAGTGVPGKSEFPPDWSDDKILDAISDVATDPASHQVKNGNRTISKGTRDGVDIETVHDDTRIITGYPANLPRNPRQ